MSRNRRQNRLTGCPSAFLNDVFSNTDFANDGSSLVVINADYTGWKPCTLFMVRSHSSIGVSFGERSISSGESWVSTDVLPAHPCVISILPTRSPSRFEIESNFQDQEILLSRKRGIQILENSTLLLDTWIP